MQTITLTDDTQTATVETTTDFPVVFAEDLTLKAVLLAITAMHAAEPIDTIDYDGSTMTLAVVLTDTRTATYTFDDLTPKSNRFEIDFGMAPSGWLESLLDLLDVVKESILDLNAQVELDTFSWASIP